MSAASCRISTTIQQFQQDKWSNISKRLAQLTDRKLLTVPNHPLMIIKQLLLFHFKKADLIEPTSPVVSIKQNFDDLLVCSNHPSRSQKDCYYINSQYMLRSHCTAHYNQLFKNKHSHLIIGDCYRRDEIDSLHFPCFHQSDFVMATSEHQFRSKLESLIFLLGQIRNVNYNFRWVKATFPFTEPSYELEIEHNNKWIEMLGCGKLKDQIKRPISDYSDVYAAGIGLDRLAMIHFDIPDIRLLWSRDDRILRQFKHMKDFFEPIQFKLPDNKYLPCSLDLSFWTLPKYNNEIVDNFNEIVHQIGGSIIEHVELIDQFTKNGKVSFCFRISYISDNCSISKDQCKLIHQKIAEKMKLLFKVEIR